MGVDIAHYRGRQLAHHDYTRFTHIFALDHSNLDAILSRMPEEATAHVGLLMDVVEGRAGEAVPDPYYGGADGFLETWADVDAAAQALVAMLRRGLA